MNSDSTDRQIQGGKEGGRKDGRKGGLINEALQQLPKTATPTAKLVFPSCSKKGRWEREREESIQRKTNMSDLTKKKLEKWMASTGTWCLPLSLPLSPTTLVLSVEFNYITLRVLRQEPKTISAVGKTMCCPRIQLHQ